MHVITRLYIIIINKIIDWRKKKKNEINESRLEHVNFADI